MHRWFNEVNLIRYEYPIMVQYLMHEQRTYQRTWYFLNVIVSRAQVKKNCTKQKVEEMGFS